MGAPSFLVSGLDMVHQLQIHCKVGVLQALLNKAAKDPLSATAISEIVEREVDLEATPLTEAEPETIRPGGASISSLLLLVGAVAAGID